MKILSVILGIILLLVAIVFSFVIRFTHISETETQLLLYHWKEWLIVLALIFSGYFFIIFAHIKNDFKERE